MNPELHHRWNSERTPTRGSDVPVEKDPQTAVPENKVTLKQNKPR